jgi:hypothetical protein
MRCNSHKISKELNNADIVHEAESQIRDFEKTKKNNSAALTEI